MFSFRFPAEQFDGTLKLVIQNTLTAISPATHSLFASIPWNCMYKFSCWQMKATEREVVQDFKPHPGKTCTFVFLFLATNTFVVVAFSVVVIHEEIFMSKEYFLEISTHAFSMVPLG